MIQLLRDSLLLEGEPDGGGAGAPAAAPPVADHGQQPPPDPASAPADGASPPEGEPAPKGEETPAGDGEGEPAEDIWGSDETWEALREQYPDRFPKAEAPKEQPLPTALQVRPNPVREYAAESGRQAWGRLQEATQALQAGEELPATFMADMEMFGSWTNAEAEGRQLDLAERLLERTLGIDPAKLDLDDPLQARYADALSEREKAHINAGREFNKVYREPDPTKRAAILARAEQQQATATAAFLLERDALLLEHGKRLGAAEKEKEAGKRITTAAEKAGRNGRTEALAQAEANLRARKATATVTSAGKPSPQNITYEQLMKMTSAETAKLSPEEVDAITSRALERS